MYAPRGSRKYSEKSFFMKFVRTCSREVSVDFFFSRELSELRLEFSDRLFFHELHYKRSLAFYNLSFILEFSEHLNTILMNVSFQSYSTTILIARKLWSLKSNSLYRYMTKFKCGCTALVLRSRVRTEVRPTKNDSTRLYKNGDISVVITCS